VAHYSAENYQKGDPSVNDEELKELFRQHKASGDAIIAEAKRRGYRHADVHIGGYMALRHVMGLEDKPQPIQQKQLSWEPEWVEDLRSTRQRMAAEGI
jgi:hypothetical protein